MMNRLEQEPPERFIYNAVTPGGEVIELPIPAQSQDGRVASTAGALVDAFSAIPRESVVFLEEPGSQPGIEHNDERLVGLDDEWGRIELYGKDIIIEENPPVVRIMDRTIELTDAEYRFLALLALNPNTVVTREFALSNVWRPDEVYDGIQTGKTTSNVLKLGNSLRKKLDPSVEKLQHRLGTEEKLLVTIRGIGHMLRTEFQQ